MPLQFRRFEMTLETYIAFCKENGYDREEFKNYKFVLKHPQRFKKFLLKQENMKEKYSIKKMIGI